MLNYYKQLLVLFFITTTLASCSKENINEEVKVYDQVAETKASYSYTEVELQILDDINEYRAELGLSQLQPIAEASIQAEDHTDYMIAKGEVSHDNFSNRYSELVVETGAKEVSENVAYGYRTADAVVKAWIKSEAHQKNIVGNYTNFGISVKEDSEGKYYFTNIFLAK
ncbi:CAP domain-containing protein [Zunongwangia sp. F363]|uniref:CAP domain-containing protein n=1 Tax=Autumnicola tepida TaxID=3075595 RepID=A0ABU3CDH7_9FLAO|nr:CAP domain-containing protein [Zunongwangia sp. F363]MDT0644387.1 CAP domain-containing protein [Zunongwangia sp. F363]